MERKNIKHMVESLFEIEQELDLFNRQIDGVHFWKLIRFRLFILLKRFAEGDGHEFKPVKKKKLIKNIFNKLVTSMRYGVGSRRSEVNTLVFEHGRKYLVDGEHVDIYTHSIVNELKAAGERVEVVDLPFNGRHYNPSGPGRSYAEHDYLWSIIKNRFSNIQLFPSEQKLISDIEMAIQTKCHYQIALYPLIISKIKWFKKEKAFYDGLLKRRNIRKVLMVVSYTWEPLIAACKENNVTSIELQHGTMSKYHVGYSFPIKNVPYFPDQLYLFGRFWKDSTPLPLAQKNIIIHGFAHFNKRNAKYADVQRISRSVLFISQPILTAQIEQIALEFAQRNPHYQVFYKRHPKEYTTSSSGYSGNEISTNFPPNVEIIASNDRDLYELLHLSEFIVGIRSTTVYEGIACGCKAVLLDLPGAELMDYLIQQDFAVLARDAVELETIIHTRQFRIIEADYFFAS